MINKSGETKCCISERFLFLLHEILYIYWIENMEKILNMEETDDEVILKVLTFFFSFTEIEEIPITQ